MKYFRKPSTYIQLPTRGIFNPEIETTIINEIPVLPMTALDEISLKNPDELLNGEALVNLFRSCVPSIPDPWKLSNIDAEALYLAVRYATYGKDETQSHTCSKCKEVTDYNIDINYILNRFPIIEKIEIVEYDGLKIYLRPNTLKSVSKVAIIEAEQKKILDFYSKNSDDSSSESLATRIFNSFKTLASHNVDLITNSVLKIVDDEDNVITDENHISEFMKNIPTTVALEIQNKVKTMASIPNDLSLMDFKCPACDNTDTVRLEFNPVNFSEAG